VTVSAIEQVTVLGATGSIGVSTLDIIARHNDKFAVFALTGHSQVEKLAQQCVVHSPRFAVVANAESAKELSVRLKSLGATTDVLYGEQALAEVAGHSDVDTVVAAIVGAAGLVPTLAAAKQGKKILLANKESLVMAGSLFMAAVKQGGATLLPVDSEHNAIFQCLPTSYKSLDAAGVSRILLTGSGGPFRDRCQSELLNVTPEQACAHPNWSMGQKISVDSATMMNKGLEFIEACWLFGARSDQIEIVIHPQSIVHSMVEYADGSVLCQMGMPDMRTPIANCLSWPKRIESGVERLDFTRLSQLDFHAPDFNRFPCLRIAIEAINHGGTVPAAINAANEEAVAAFLKGQVSFLDIPRVVAEVANGWSHGEPLGLADVISADQEARILSQRYIATLN
jgi:1-deoxy-D-xylulose-5-phosphate reductoisomerase